MARISRSNTGGDQQRFANEDLVLQVRSAVDPTRWDEDRYVPFFEALCPGREFQIEALRVALRFLLGGEYADLRALAKENYDASEILRARYGSWESFEAALPLPSMLSATLDLATGAGKSYVLYGLAAVALSEGIVDRVLVLCPSTTIERELIEKFHTLARDSNLRDLLPANAVISNPSIIKGNETIIAGSICIENFHATFENTGSSLRVSLEGKGAKTLVLNDETHHIANDSGEVRKWKEFLTGQIPLRQAERLAANPEELLQ
jgi:type III restriction enzyme